MAENEGLWVNLGYALLGGAFLIKGLTGLKAHYNQSKSVAALKPAPTNGLGFQDAQGETMKEGIARTTGLIQKTRMVSVRTIAQRVGYIGEYIKKGSLDPKIRAEALGVLTRKCGAPGNRQWCVPPKDTEAEIKALYAAITDPNSPIAIRYTKDHVTVDQFTNPWKTLQLRGGDCLPGETLLLTPNGFKPIAEVRIGDIVMGDGQWVRVLNWWDKGVLPVRSIALSTGGVLACTDEHRLFVVPPRRGGRIRGEAEALVAAEVEEGDHLLTAASIPEGTEALAAERAWLLGVYVADGWVEYGDDGRPKRVRIAGKDGHPKEAQKRRIESICASMGIRTTWHERYITLTDPALAEEFGALGRHAHEKRLPHVNWTAKTAAAILSGLAADATVNDKGTLTYSTTSETLALQIRVLHRILGERVNIHRVDDHGGLGTHPIYRCSVIRPFHANGRRGAEFAIVKDIVGSDREMNVFDIAVEGQRFYLPEHDVVVHNCDDYVATLGAMLMSVGIPVRMTVVQAKGESTWSHIYLKAQSKNKLGQAYWMPLDPTMPYGPGWEAEDFRLEKDSSGKPIRKDFEVNV